MGDCTEIIELLSLYRKNSQQTPLSRIKVTHFVQVVPQAYTLSQQTACRTAHLPLYRGNFMKTSLEKVIETAAGSSWQGHISRHEAVAQPWQ